MYALKEIDNHILVAVAGLTADSARMVEHARLEAQNHFFVYNEPLSLESTTQALCDLALKFGSDEESAMSRPFGVSLIVAGVDEEGPQLYVTDPSGTYFEYAAKAIGSGMKTAQENLEELYRTEMTLKEAENLAFSTLKQVMINDVSSSTVDLAFVRLVKDENGLSTGKLERYTKQQIEEIVKRISGDEIDLLTSAGGDEKS